MILSLLLSLNVQTQAFQAEQNFFDSQGQPAKVEDLVQQIVPGDYVVIGEQHGFAPHHSLQEDIIKRLQAAQLKVDLGLEHISYDEQNILDGYLQKKLSEEEFLKKVGWGSSVKYKTCYDYTDKKGYEDPFAALPFDCYRSQIDSVNSMGGNVFGINLNRRISGKVSRDGLNSLTPDEFNMLPPFFELGNDLYYQRFKEAMTGGGGHHGPIDESVIKRMFLAQSLWDDTMAWQSLHRSDTHVMVIVVGDFHARFGGGLPDRLSVRGANRVWVISQDVIFDGQPKDITELALPSKKHGARADLINVTNFIE